MLLMHKLLKTGLTYKYRQKSRKCLVL